MSRVYPELVGEVFGALTVLERVDNDRHDHRRWSCRCVCERVIEVRGANLASGAQVSCGCMRVVRQLLRAEKRNRQNPRDDEGHLLCKRARLYWREGRR